MLAQVSHYYRKFIEAKDDVALGNNLITDINGHPTQFPVGTFNAPMTAFAPIQTTYAGLAHDAEDGGAVEVKARNKYRTETWLPEVDKIAVLVNNQAAGDPSIILLSGFNATKQTADASVIPVQMQLSGSSPADAEFKYESKTIVDSHAFTLIGTIAADGTTVDQVGDTIVITTTKATKIVVQNTNNKKGLITGLTYFSSMKVNWIMIPRNSAGSGPKSFAITLTIQ